MSGVTTRHVASLVMSADMNADRRQMRQRMFRKGWAPVPKILSATSRSSPSRS
ncbi:hypothetical protein GBAR_LOCUS1700 [Geodia barretti]|uniref:Uncharacterized protein n=1 Tax=Geodia barretti TaxID=519541 RepID=A0AA35W3F2_GEOBA|nr:hypothetical protein GBAR_LOCUS1700 [Geodia barretti]